MCVRFKKVFQQTPTAALSTQKPFPVDRRPLSPPKGENIKTARRFPAESVCVGVSLKKLCESIVLSEDHEVRDRRATHTRTHTHFSSRSQNTETNSPTASPYNKTRSTISAATCMGFEAISHVLQWVLWLVVYGPSTRRNSCYTTINFLAFQSVPLHTHTRTHR